MGSFMSRNDRYVVRQGKDWAVKKSGGAVPDSAHGRQSDAERAAKDTVPRLGGGEVRIEGRGGRWRDSDTVAPGVIRFRHGTRSIEKSFRPGDVVPS